VKRKNFKRARPLKKRIKSFQILLLMSKRKLIMIMQRKIAAEVEQGLPEDVLEAQAAEVANGGNIAKEMILQTVDLDLDRALDQLEEDLPEIGIATDREKDKDSVESVKEKENMKENVNEEKENENVANGKDVNKNVVIKNVEIENVNDVNENVENGNERNVNVKNNNFAGVKLKKNADVKLKSRKNVNNKGSKVLVPKMKMNRGDIHGKNESANRKIVPIMIVVTNPERKKEE